VTLADVTEPAVWAAIAEYDRLGRERFLEESGFGPAKSYFLEHNGVLYDSKAIVGVAHGISGDRAWRAEDFSGGEKIVGNTLRRLGFTAVARWYAVGLQRRAEAQTQADQAAEVSQAAREQAEQVAREAELAHDRAERQHIARAFDDDWLDQADLKDTARLWRTANLRAAGGDEWAREAYARSGPT
jgi:hypothetical protein